MKPLHPSSSGNTTNPSNVVEISPAASREVGHSAVDASSGAEQQKTACERVFEHWVYMLGLPPKRCALGPKRRAVIERALALYDVEVLLLAVEGCAASAWHNGANDRNRAYQDIELILRDERHVEDFAARGDELRAQVLAAQRREANAPVPIVPIVPPVPPDAAATQAARERTLAMAMRMRTGGGTGGNGGGGGRG